MEANVRNEDLAWMMDGRVGSGWLGGGGGCCSLYGVRLFGWAGTNYGVGCLIRAWPVSTQCNVNGEPVNEGGSRLGEESGSGWHGWVARRNEGL